MDHDHPDKALQVLAQLHAHGDQNDPWVLAEYEQIQASIQHEHQHEAKSYVELFKSRSSFRRLFLWRRHSSISTDDWCQRHSILLACHLW